MVISPAPAQRKHRVSLDDWAMLLLAVLAVGLLAYLRFWHPPPDQVRLITWVDRGLCAAFAVEFLARWWSAGFTRRFVLVNWYDLVGMVPVASLWFRVFRVLRVVRIGVQLTRLRRPVDRSVGEELAHRAMARFGGVLIDVVKKPLTVAVLEEVVSVLRTGHYARNLASALEENRAEIRAMVLEKIRQDPQAGLFRRMPFHDEVVGTVTDATLRVLLEMLADPRTDELISDLLRENIEQIRAAVRADAHKNLPEQDPPDR
ncbi:ion transporter [Actinokineospora diospyrosa]|uniref:Ion transport protein n=1 Tax=Actinokineospora diospyrosa TaxID=103728 RepID=A0ABT1I7D9_9PSEU|nr:ion transporter [Actinokineospora diospyrosa]MCP2268545.1 Ion transport protein [Actinokineospora diospyrosa]